MSTVWDLPENMRSKIAVTGDCWFWTGARNKRGYGSTSNGKGGSVLAHRRAYELLVAPIPGGMTIDHMCLRPRCINPEHLQVVTVAENTRLRYTRRDPYRPTPEPVQFDGPLFDFEITEESLLQYFRDLGAAMAERNARAERA